MENKLSSIEKLILACLRGGPLAGRPLAKALHDKYGVKINYGGLYIKTRYLEEGGLITAKDAIDGGGRVSRVFKLTRPGEIDSQP